MKELLSIKISSSIIELKPYYLVSSFLIDIMTTVYFELIGAIFMNSENTAYYDVIYLSTKFDKKFILSIKAIKLR